MNPSPHPNLTMELPQMRSGQSRFVTACQQVLVLGVVAAVLAPAATVLSLEIVAPGSGSPAPGAHRPAAAVVAEVETEPVEPVITEQRLTADGGPSARRPGGLPEVRTTPRGEERVVGEPEAADGFRTVGVTWDETEQVAEGELTVEVRTRDRDGDWSGWSALEYSDQHGPDAGSREARRARPGTEPLVVGDVADVQVRATGDVPDDLTAAVIDPGTSQDTELAEPAIDTGGASVTDASSANAATVAGTTDESSVALSAGLSAPKPQIFSRAQWGADERLRDRGSLRYGKVRAGFVHHTVNGNSYTKAQVPGILRSIYAYHTRSRGWSDVGYNFLVDKFGRIWEGRYGGVHRPVVGAHTLGYNESSFAMSAIGNFETARPSDAMLAAYGRLMAWKLSLHGIRANSANQVVSGKRLRAINGHRDAGSTACPGRYLYARLGAIRSMAAAGQQQPEPEPELDVTGGERETDLVDTAHPDIVLRRDSDKQVFLLPTGGLTRMAEPRTAAWGWAGRRPVASPDLDGDGKGDVIATGNRRGVLWSGRGNGTFRRTHAVRVLRHKDLVAAVGDLDNDGDNDLVGRRRDGRAVAFLGIGRGRFVARTLGRGWRAANLTAGVGDLTGDGNVDLVVRHAGGVLRLLRGDGAGGFSGGSSVPGSWGRYNRITGFGDWNRDGHGDLFARGHGGAGWVLPGRGDGTFMRRFGPVWRVHGLVGLSSGGSVAGNAAPDLVGVSRGRLKVLRNTGRFDASAPRPTGLFLSEVNALLNVGDWDRDGHGDMVSRHRNGVLRLHRGDGEGGFAPQRRLGTGFNQAGRLASVGDVTGDGWPDIMGQPEGGPVRIYPGRGLDGVGAGQEARLRSSRALNVKPYDWVISLGYAKGPDTAARARATGVLWLLSTNAKGLTVRRFLAEGLDAYDMYGS